MINIQSGNLLNIKEGIIVHQVNLKGVMGAGLAKQIRDKYPKVYDCYQVAIQDNCFKLGDVQIINVTDALQVANIFAQNNYGRAKGKCYTHYNALAMALSKLNGIQRCISLPIYLPYGIGCGLAGGDWKIVSELIFKHLPQAIILRYDALK